MTLPHIPTVVVAVLAAFALLTVYHMTFGRRRR